MRALFRDVGRCDYDAHRLEHEPMAANLVSGSQARVKGNLAAACLPGPHALSVGRPRVRSGRERTHGADADDRATGFARQRGTGHRVRDPGVGPDGARRVGHGGAGEPGGGAAAAAAARASDDSDPDVGDAAVGAGGLAGDGVGDLAGAVRSSRAPRTRRGGRRGRRAGDST